MLNRMMLGSGRREERAVLAKVARSGGLVVLHGHRRMGKTRLLVEWAQERGAGVYFVADQSAGDVQRRYFAEAVAERLPGFADVRYQDWRSLFSRLAADAAAAKFRGPIVIDELPYLVDSAPELPSVLRLFCDQAERGKLAIAVAGSDRKAMQAIALAPDAPLFGRARAQLEIGPLGPERLGAFFGRPTPGRLLDLFSAWGGVPRYWELAKAQRGTVLDAIDALVLDPRGVLHEEPIRLLREESAASFELRPLLDAIGAGAHRVSEIAARIGRPQTSLSRALERLRELGLIEREIPFGQNERDTKRTQYKLVDPFLRLWFRVVGPHRGQLAMAPKRTRLALLATHWQALRAEAWEQLCLQQLARPHVRPKSFGTWQPPRRYWQGSVADWDLVTEATAKSAKTLLLGEARCHPKTPTLPELAAQAQAIAAKTAPALGRGYDDHRQIRVLMVPEVPPRTPPSLHGVRLLTLTGLVPQRATS